MAWNPLGWSAVAFSEIEPFPCAVLAHHYPNVPNWGDMTKYKEWPDADVDLLCGGTPCQSFSVAGLRKGLDDPRGNLMLTFGAIAAKYRPKWVVWENVPGVLSSNRGRDFGTFLGMLGQLGYGFAYRILDAQYFGVAQRRRRVFVVGCLGDWRSAAAVLFERHSMSGHPAPSRGTGEETAGTLASRTGAGGFPGTDEACSGYVQPDHLKPDPHTSAPLKCSQNSAVCITGDITHTLKAEGFDASEDGTGRGTPLVPVAFDTTQITSRENGSNPKPGDPCHPLAAGAHAPAIAFDCKSSGQNGFGVGVEAAGTQRAMAHAGSHSNGGGHQAVAFQTSQSGVRIDDVHATLDSNNGSRRHNGALLGMQVRRLTPEECEALQSFPRNYTRIQWRNKPADQCPDGPRYKALGNSWCVNNVRWIGKRIQQVDQFESS
ncbi:DNA cytosine methyltransferase [Pusillimonas noertemannii]|uniref:DNA cytosine methyltransferase n=1 Tax=Pusillimonas noertemannii TaxID=305977 RepID=UPI001FD45C9C